MATLLEDIEFFKLRLQSQPDTLLFARLADYLRQNGEVEEAIQVCENGLKKHPYYVTAHFILGKCFLEKKQFDQALNEFKRVLNFDPRFLAAHKFHAEIMEHLGWDNAIENSYRQMVQIDPYDSETKEKLNTLLFLKKSEAQDAEPGTPFDSQFQFDDEMEKEIAGTRDFIVEEKDGTYLPEESTAGTGIIDDENAIPADTASEEELEAFEDLPELEELEDLQSPVGSEEALLTDEIAEMPADDEILAKDKIVPEAEKFEFDEALEIEIPDAPKSPAQPVSKIQPLTEMTPTESLFEAVIEETPPTAEDEEKFSYILDDIFRDEESAIEAQNPPAEKPAEEFDFLGDLDAEDETGSDLILEEEEPETASENNLADTDPESESEPPISLDSDEDELQSDSDQVLDDIFIPAESEDDSSELTHENLPEDDAYDSEPVMDDNQMFERLRNFTGDNSAPKPVADDTTASMKKSEPKKPEELVEPDDELTGDISEIRKKKEKIVTPTLGEIYSAQGQYAKAIGVFEILRKKEPNNPAYMEKIKFLKRKLVEAGEQE